MEKLKHLKTMVILLSAILLLNMGLLLFMLPLESTFIWITLATMSIAIVYLVVLSWNLVKELIEREQKALKDKTSNK